MQDRLRGYPTAEGVVLTDGKKRAAAVRKANGNIALTVSAVKESRFASYPGVRGLARFFRALFAPAASLLFGEGTQAAVRVYPFEKKIARSLHMRPLAVACTVTCIEAILTAAIGLFLVPLLFSLFTGGAFLALVRTVLFALVMYRFSRIRFLRRLSMYAGAEHKLRNSVRRGAGADYESMLKSSRLLTGADSGFFAACLILWYFVSALFAARGMGAWASAIGIVLIPAALGELFRLIEKDGSPFYLPVLYLQRLMVLEPHVEMLELAQVAHRALEEEA